MDSPGLRIGVLNTGIASGNGGDFIIMDAALRQLDACFPLAQRIHFTTHEKLSRTSRRLQRDIAFNVACGTNLLHSHMAIVKQWQIGLLASRWMKPVILLGVGWRSRASRATSPYTRWLLKALLSREGLHSVRDSYTRKKLEEIGIRNVVNTACPTMWPLTPDFCARIPAEKGEDAVATLTDYSPDPQRDRQLIDALCRAYRRVYFWCQGSGDHAYLSSLGKQGAVELIGANLTSFDALLADGALALDYVGTRLHGGIRALQHGRRTLIVGIDHRAEEKRHDFNLPVVDRYAAADVLQRVIRAPAACDIRIPLESIQRWKEQFRGATAAGQAETSTRKTGVVT
jgi:polysaccharide pyruvyl transferase WcaK-like protein